MVDGYRVDGFDPDSLNVWDSVDGELVPTRGIEPLSAVSTSKASGGLAVSGQLRRDTDAGQGELPAMLGENLAFVSDVDSPESALSTDVQAGDVVHVDERTGRSILATGKTSGGLSHTGFAPVIPSEIFPHYDQ